MNEDTNEAKLSIGELAAEHFTRDYNCCESVLLAASGYLNIDSGMIPRIATPFGGGISEHSYICGALSGALMAIGLKYGRDDCSQEREPAKERAGRFIRRFIDKYGAVNCSSIIGCNAADIEARKEHIRSTICTPLVREVAQWLAEELE